MTAFDLISSLSKMCEPADGFVQHRTGKLLSSQEQALLCRWFSSGCVSKKSGILNSLVHGAGPDATPKEGMRGCGNGMVSYELDFRHAHGAQY